MKMGTPILALLKPNRRSGIGVLKFDIAKINISNNMFLQCYGRYILNVVIMTKCCRFLHNLTY